MPGQLLKSTIIAWISLVLSFSQDKCWSQKPTLVEGQLFYPSSQREGDWQPKYLSYQNVEFVSADGTQLHGWFCEQQNPQAIVLFAHGNAGNVATRAAFLNQVMSKTNVSIFIFDYRGYGKSHGVPTIKGVMEDARAARAKLCEMCSIDDSEMVLMGESLGGAIAVQLAAESAPRCLILQSTFSSLRDAADLLFPPAIAFLVRSDLLDSTSSIRKYSGPLFQSHGDADRTISFELGKKLFQSANEPKTFYRVPRADHNGWLTGKYLQKLDQFLLKLPPAK